MDPDDAGASPTPDATRAGTSLWPAFRLWLGYEALWGAYRLLMSLGHGFSAEAADVGHLVTSLATYVMIGVAAWRDRVACRVFALPRRGVVELCIVAGIAGSMLIAMLESHIGDWHTDPLTWERDLGVAGCLVSVALLPAVFEELMFRGVLQQRLRQVLTLPQAIAVQAMLFALLHLDAAYVLPHFAFGCLAGFLRSAARSLWPCMLLHFLWNGWCVLGEFGWL